MKHVRYTDSQKLRDALVFHKLKLSPLVDILLGMFLNGELDTILVVDRVHKRREEVMRMVTGILLENRYDRTLDKSRQK